MQEWGTHQEPPVESLPALPLDGIMRCPSLSRISPPAGLPLHLRKPRILRGELAATITTTIRLIGGGREKHVGRGERGTGEDGAPV
jgi:hypothetical protein